MALKKKHFGNTVRNGENSENQDFILFQNIFFLTVADIISLINKLAPHVICKLAVNSD